MLNDFHNREKISHFDHERIPERVVHARGAGAFGEFRLHTPLKGLTTAKVCSSTTRVSALTADPHGHVQGHARLRPILHRQRIARQRRHGPRPARFRRQAVF